MKAWTDYPILDLGDKSGQEAPIRRVEILSYDRDKYCRIRVEGIIDLVKRGYLYRNPGRLGEATPVSTRALNKLPTTQYGTTHNG